MTSNSGPGFAQHPEHTVETQPFAGRVVVTVAGQTLADSRSAIALSEASYPVVYYVPRSDVRMELLERTEHSTYCPFKGHASYFSIPGRAENAVWSYEAPYDEVAGIRDHLAFYPQHVDSIRVEPA